MADTLESYWLLKYAEQDEALLGDPLVQDRFIQKADEVLLLIPMGSSALARALFGLRLVIVSLVAVIDASPGRLAASLQGKGKLEYTVIDCLDRMSNAKKSEDRGACERHLGNALMKSDYWVDEFETLWGVSLYEGEEGLVLVSDHQKVKGVLVMIPCMGNLYYNISLVSKLVEKLEDRVPNMRAGSTFTFENDSFRGLTLLHIYVMTSFDTGATTAEGGKYYTRDEHLEGITLATTALKKFMHSGPANKNKDVYTGVCIFLDGVKEFVDDERVGELVDELITNCKALSEKPRDASRQAKTQTSLNSLGHLEVEGDGFETFSNTTKKVRELLFGPSGKLISPGRDESHEDSVATLLEHLCKIKERPKGGAAPPADEPLDMDVDANGPETTTQLSSLKLTVNARRALHAYRALGKTVEDKFVAFGFAGGLQKAEIAMGHMQAVSEQRNDVYGVNSVALSLYNLLEVDVRAGRVFELDREHAKLSSLAETIRTEVVKEIKWKASVKKEMKTKEVLQIALQADSIANYEAAPLATQVRNLDESLLSFNLLVGKEEKRWLDYEFDATDFRKMMASARAVLAEGKLVDHLRKFEETPEEEMTAELSEAIMRDVAAELREFTATQVPTKEVCPQLLNEAKEMAAQVQPAPKRSKK